MRIRKVLIVAMLIGVVVLAGCAEDLPPKEFIKASYANTAKIYSDVEKLGGKLVYNAELTMNPEEVDRVVTNLPPQFQMPLPLSAILKNELSAEAVLNIKMNQKTFAMSGDAKASYTSAIMSQKFDADYYFSPTPEGGLFYTLYNTDDWKILAPGYIFAAQFEEMNMTEMAQIQSWEDYEKIFTKDEIEQLKAIVDQLMADMEIINDVTEDGIRSIEFTVDFAEPYGDFMELYLNSDIVTSTSQQLPEEQIAMMKDMFKKYLKGVKSNIVLKADAKDAEMKGMDFKFILDKDSVAVQELSKMLEFEEPIDLTFTIGGGFEYTKLDPESTIRPAGLSAAKQKEMVGQFTEEQIVYVENNLSMIGNAVENHYHNNGQFPENLADLLQNQSQAQILLDPFTKKEYKYESIGTTYKIYSAGPDTKYNTEDDIVKTGEVE